MKLNRTALLFVWLSASAVAQDGLELMDNAAFYMIDVEEFEIADGSDLAWDADFWAGTDIDRLWLKSKGEHTDNGDDHSELQVLYSRAIAPFWNLHAGLRREFDPSPEQNSAMLAIEGLAPYGIDVEAEVFFAEGGRTSLRLHSSYELLLTQRLVLTPEAELTAFSRSDALRGVGSGVSRLELGLRLRYEIRREFAPYIGLRWFQLRGGTEDLAMTRGHDADDFEVVAGVRFWY